MERNPRYNPSPRKCSEPLLCPWGQHDYSSQTAVSNFLTNMFASLSHRLQRILSLIHQYNIGILFKSRPQLFSTDWLSRHNLETNKDEKIPGMCIPINAIKSCMYKSDCMTAEEITMANIGNEHLCILSEHALCDQPSTKAEVQKGTSAILVIQR